MNCKPRLWKHTARTWRRHWNRWCFMHGETLEARKALLPSTTYFWRQVSWSYLIHYSETPEHQPRESKGEAPDLSDGVPHDPSPNRFSGWTDPPAANRCFIMNAYNVHLGNPTRFCSHAYKYEPSIQFKGSTELKQKLPVFETGKPNGTFEFSTEFSVDTEHAVLCPFSLPCLSTNPKFPNSELSLPLSRMGPALNRWRGRGRAGPHQPPSHHSAGGRPAGDKQEVRPGWGRAGQGGALPGRSRTPAPPVPRHGRVGRVLVIYTT